jgi:competence protein ComEC
MSRNGSSLRQEDWSAKWNRVSDGQKEVAGVRRPLLPLACGMVFGILGANYLRFGAVLIAALFCLIVCFVPRLSVWRSLAAALLIGALWLLVRSPVWPGSFGPRQSTVVVQQVVVEDNLTTLTVAPRCLDGRKVPAWNPILARLYLSGGDYRVGETLSGLIDWEQPERPMNPGQFDYATYQRRQGILASSFLAADVELAHRDLTGQVIGSLRSRLVQRAKQIPGLAGELLATLLLGESSGDWALPFRRAGLAHVLAVSGLHVGLLLAMLLWLLRLLRLRKTWQYLLSAIALLGFGLLVGPRASVWRAIIMALIGLLALATGRLKDWPSALAAAMLLLLIYNPWLLFDAGWQLSFLATWGVLALGPAVGSHLPLLPGHLDGLISISLAAQAATLPLVLFYFYLVTPLALISNLLVVPLLPIVLGLGVLYLLLTPLTGLLLPLLAWVLNLLLALVGWLASWPAMSFSPGQPPWFLVVLPLGLLFAITLNQRTELRRWLVGGWLFFCLLGLFWQPMVRFVGNRYQLRVLSVGQGEAIALHLPSGEALLFDVGGAGQRIGEKVIVPYLRQQGTFYIGGIYLSHLHTDHIVGLRDVLANFPVRAIYLAEACKEAEGFADLLDLTNQFAVPLCLLSAGDELTAQAVRVRVLYPHPGETGGLANEDSLVLELCWPGLRVLLPGDTGSQSEELFLSSVETPVDVLLVAHHGSAYSSSQEFLTAVSPALSVISTGPNRYGHPAPATVERLLRSSRRVLRTDQTGAILIWTNLRASGLDTFLRPDMTSAKGR